MSIPVAEQDHVAHDVLVRQGASGVLAAPDRDLDDVRIVAGEPDVAAARGRRARPDRDGAAVEADEWTARAAIAATHERGETAPLSPSPSTRPLTTTCGV